MYSPPPLLRGNEFDRLLNESLLPAPTAFMRRAALEEVGPYDETLVFDDYDMWLRLADRFDFAYRPATVVNYRVHAAGLTRDPLRRVDVHEAVARTLMKWFGRSQTTDHTIAGRVWTHSLKVHVADYHRARPL